MDLVLVISLVLGLLTTRHLLNLRGKPKETRLDLNLWIPKKNLLTDEMISEINEVNQLTFPKTNEGVTICESQDLRLILGASGLSVECISSQFPEIVLYGPDIQSESYDSWPLHFSGFSAYRVRAPSRKLLGLINAQLIKKLDSFDQVVLSPTGYTFHGAGSPRGVALALEVALYMLQADPLQITLEQTRDSDPLVRSRALNITFRYYRNRKAARQAARASLKDHDDRNRLQAVRILGREAIPYLRNRIEKSGLHQNGAVAALGDIDCPEVIDFFLELLSGPHVKKILGASLFPALTGRVDQRFSEPLIALLRRLDSLGLSFEWGFEDTAAKLLGEIGSPEATPVLIGLLQRKSLAFPTLISALGQIGDARAVAPLQRLGPSLDVKEQLLARKAVYSIQMRLGQVERGWLTMTENDQQGALSLANDDEGGGLKLVDGTQET